MLNPRRILAVLMLGSAAACALPADWRPDQRLRVRADPPHLVLSNGTARPVYFTALESDFAALALWAPCAHPERCAHVPARERVRLPYHSIGGYHQGAAVALVYWWHLDAGPDGGFRPDSIRTERVRLR